jgi:hypothetical protein
MGTGTDITKLTFVFNEPVFDDNFMTAYPSDIFNRGTFPNIGNDTCPSFRSR